MMFYHNPHLTVLPQRLQRHLTEVFSKISCLGFTRPTDLDPDHWHFDHIDLEMLSVLC